MANIGNGIARCVFFMLFAMPLVAANAQVMPAAGAKPPLTTLPNATFNMNCHCVGLLCSCLMVAPNVSAVKTMAGQVSAQRTPKGQFPLSLTPEQYGALSESLGNVPPAQ
jgi:hypothetical protein